MRPLRAELNSPLEAHEPFADDVISRRHRRSPVDDLVDFAGGPLGHVDGGENGGRHPWAKGTVAAVKRKADDLSLGNLDLDTVVTRAPI